MVAREEGGGWCGGVHRVMMMVILWKMKVIQSWKLSREESYLVMKVIIVERSDDLWRFACGDVLPTSNLMTVATINENNFQRRHFDFSDDVNIITMTNVYISEARRLFSTLWKEKEMEFWPNLFTGSVIQGVFFHPKKSTKKTQSIRTVPTQKCLSMEKVEILELFHIVRVGKV